MRHFLEFPFSPLSWDLPRLLVLARGWLAGWRVLLAAAVFIVGTDAFTLGKLAVYGMNGMLLHDAAGLSLSTTPSVRPSYSHRVIMRNVSESWRDEVNSPHGMSSRSSARGVGGIGGFLSRIGAKPNAALEMPVTRARELSSKTLRAVLLYRTTYAYSLVRRGNSMGHSSMSRIS
jgi:hypothetical protein